MTSRALLFLAIAALIATPAAAKLYQWVDENGVKHFSVDPPPSAGIQYKERKEVKSAAPEPAPAQPQQPEPEQPPAPATAQPAVDPLEQQMEKAYTALKRIQTGTDSGISYNAYAEMVRDAGFELAMAREAHSSWARQQQVFSSAYKRLETIFSLYEDAKSLWYSRHQDSRATVEALTDRLGDKYDITLDYNDTIDRSVQGRSWKRAAESMVRKMWHQAADKLKRAR